MSRSSGSTGDPATKQDERLRAACIQARSGVPEAARTAAALAVLAHARQRREWRDAADLAAYLPFRGEFDALPLLHAAHADGKRCHVPVLAERRMGFRRWTPDLALAPNRFGIPEPAEGEVVAPEALDLVFAPLLAFDRAGHRMGMGGGYYDRSFAFRLTAECPRPGPCFVGLAFALQQVAALEPNPWDVPLDAVLTEEGWREFEHLERR